MAAMEIVGTDAHGQKLYAIIVSELELLSFQHGTAMVEDSMREAQSMVTRTTSAEHYKEALDRVVKLKATIATEEFN